jgi:hypothetical protein
VERGWRDRRGAGEIAQESNRVRTNEPETSACPAIFVIGILISDPFLFPLVIVIENWQIALASICLSFEFLCFPLPFVPGRASVCCFYPFQWRGAGECQRAQDSTGSRCDRHGLDMPDVLPMSSRPNSLT